jgi:hypothetical protein
MDDHEQLIDISKRLAAAIGQRDIAAVRSLLAKGFVQRRRQRPGRRRCLSPAHEDLATSCS